MSYNHLEVNLQKKILGETLIIKIDYWTFLSYILIIRYKK